MKNSIGLLFLITFFFAFTTYAQDLQVQLATEHKTYSNTDTAVAMQLIRRGAMLRNRRPDSSKNSYEQALLLSKNTGFVDGVASSLLGMAANYLDRNELNKSIILLASAIPFCEKASSKNRKLNVLVNNGLAVVYSQLGISDTAIFYYYKSLEAYDKEKINDTPMLLLLYNNIGGSLVNNFQYDQGLYYLKKAQTINLKKGTEKLVGNTYVNMGAAYQGKKMLDSAFFYTNKAAAIGKKNNDPLLEAFSSYTLGTLYLDKEKPAQSIVYFQNAIKTDSSMQSMQISYRGLAAAYNKLKKYSLAEVYYLKALNISKSANRMRDAAELYDELADMYLEMKNYRSAFENKQAYSKLRDSILTTEKFLATSQLEIKYRSLEKDKDIAKKQLQLNKQESSLKQKNIWIISVLSGSFLLILLVSSIYISIKRKQKLQQTEIENLQKEYEIEQLKATMSGEEKERVRIARELHDGIMVQFSSVKMNLSAMLERSANQYDISDFNKIVAQLDNATKELRKSAHNLMPDMLLEEGLSEAVHYFCKNLQQSLGLEIEFQQYGSLPPIHKEYELMIYRIVQELLQNTMKHAQANHVLVQINCKENLLSITIEDNGKGFDKKQLGENKGMGLKGIQKRVRSLQGQIEINSEINIGTTVYIEFDTVHFKKQSDSYAYNGSYNR